MLDTTTLTSTYQIIVVVLITKDDIPTQRGKSGGTITKHSGNINALLLSNLTIALQVQMGYVTGACINARPIHGRHAFGLQLPAKSFDCQIL